MKKSNIFLSLGMFSLSASIIIKRFGGEMLNTNFIDFTEGFFLALSLVFNIAFLLLLKRERQM
jgi:hypothetical protein